MGTDSLEGPHTGRLIARPGKVLVRRARQKIDPRPAAMFGFVCSRVSAGRTGTFAGTAAAAPQVGIGRRWCMGSSWSTADWTGTGSARARQPVDSCSGTAEWSTGPLRPALLPEQSDGAANLRKSVSTAQTERPQATFQSHHFLMEMNLRCR